MLGTKADSIRVWVGFGVCFLLLICSAGLRMKTKRKRKRRKEEWDGGGSTTDPLLQHNRGTVSTYEL